MFKMDSRITLIIKKASVLLNIFQKPRNTNMLFLSNVSMRKRTVNILMINCKIMKIYI